MKTYEPQCLKEQENVYLKFGMLCFTSREQGENQRVICFPLPSESLIFLFKKTSQLSGVFSAPGERIFSKWSPLNSVQNHLYPAPTLSPRRIASTETFNLSTSETRRVSIGVTWPRDMRHIRSKVNWKWQMM